MKNVGADLFGSPSPAHKEKKEKAAEPATQKAEEIAEKEGYMRVDDRASSPSILYANPANDISDAVLSKMGYAK